MPSQIWKPSSGLALACTLLLWFGRTAMSNHVGCFDDNPSDTTAETGPQVLANGSMYFALSLFKSVTKPPSLPTSGNCHISPVSVRIGLLLTYLGAKGSTKTEMQTALHFGNLHQEDLLRVYHQLRAVLVHNATDTANYTLTIADRIFFDEGSQLRGCMAERLESDLEKVDFRSAPEPSRQRINQWVEDRTNRRIVGLLPPGKITSDMIMVVTNAMYFRGAWAKPFPVHSTNDQDFFVQPKNRKRVRTMRIESEIFSYGISSQLDCEALELPYSGNEMGMVILLPKSNVHDLIKKLSVKNLKNLFAQLKPTTLKVSLPKFNFTQSFDLKRNLESLGMKDVFHPSKADLSGFTGSKNVFAAFVQHKTFIQVGEYGTEAAAATAVGVGPPSMPMDIVPFRVDRPFLFLIRNIKYDAILFMGLVKDPTAQH